MNLFKVIILIDIFFVYDSFDFIFKIFNFLLKYFDFLFKSLIVDGRL